jgi:hypothetical protein
MPSLLEKLPRPNEVRSVTIGSGDAVPSAVAQVMAVMDSLRKST